MKPDETQAYARDICKQRPARKIQTMNTPTFTLNRPSSLAPGRFLSAVLGSVLLCATAAQAAEPLLPQLEVSDDGFHGKGPEEKEENEIDAKMDEEQQGVELEHRSSSRQWVVNAARPVRCGGLLQTRRSCKCLPRKCQMIYGAVRNTWSRRLWQDGGPSTMELTRPSSGG